MNEYSLVLPIVKMILSDWDEIDINYYFKMAYGDIDMSIAIETNDKTIARQIANEVVSKMRALKK
jgi:hypothetical protein